MKIDLLISQRILVCIWNKHLATTLAQMLTTIHLNNPQLSTVVGCVTRNDKWFVDGEEIFKTYHRLLPQLVVFDPFAIGVPPNEDPFYLNGFVMAQEFDSNPHLQQILWTAIDREMLPNVPRSPIIPQGMSLPLVVSEISNYFAN